MAAEKPSSGTAPKPDADPSSGGEPAGSESTPAGKPDKPPTGKRGPGRPKGSKTKRKNEGGEPASPERVTNAKLRKQLRGILGGPGLAYEAMGEDWPAKHVSESAPPLANQIVNYAEKNPAFKIRLESFLEGGELAGLVVAGVMYAAPQAIYFGLIPVPERVKVSLNIPERAPSTIGPPGMPPDMRAQMEADALERGFVDAHGNPDVDSFMREVQEAASKVRGPAG